MTAPVVVAVLLASAVCLWPGSSRGRAARGVLPVARAGFPTTVARWGRRVARRGEDAEETALIEVVESLDASLAAGAAPADALSGVIETRAAVRSNGRPTTRVDEALPALLTRARAGDGLASGWAEVARTTGSAQVAVLARAWTLSEVSGAPLSAAARTAARLLRQARDERRRTRTAIAGARATMTVLTALPIGGPALALLLGLDPGRVYLGSPLVALMLAGGVTLVLVGRWWVTRLVAATLRGPVLS